MTRRSSGLLVLLAVGGLVVAADPPAPPAKPKVKEITSGASGTKRYEGVVDQIDADGLTLVEITDDKQVKEHRLAPIDLLRKGDVLPKVFGSFTYRWQDIKRGDTVVLFAEKDEGDGVMYCMRINIKRRPGAKLPESQNPKQDTNQGQRISNC